MIILIYLKVLKFKIKKFYDLNVVTKMKSKFLYIKIFFSHHNHIKKKKRAEVKYDLMCFFI